MYDERVIIGLGTEAHFLADHPPFEPYPCEHDGIAHDDLPLGDSRRHHPDAWVPEQAVVNVKSDTGYSNIAMEQMSVAALANAAHYGYMEARLAVWFDDEWHYMDPAEAPMHCRWSGTGKGTKGSGTPHLLVAKDSEGWSTLIRIGHQPGAGETKGQR